MTFVLRCEGFASGESTCSIAGQYLKEFDHEALDGQGDGVFTSDPERALQFDSHGAAFLFWRKQPECKPLRRDGKPNRPLTAMTVSILPLEAAMTNSS